MPDDSQPTPASPSLTPSPTPLDEHPASPSLNSPTSGRFINVSSSLPAVGSLPHSDQRLSRPPVPSPLSTASNIVKSAISTKPPDPAAPATQKGPRLFGRESTGGHTTKAAVGFAAFHSDSSDPSTPEEESSRLKFFSQPDGSRSISELTGLKAASGPPDAAKPLTVATMAANTKPPANALRRKPSIETALSAISSKQVSSSQTDTQDGSISSDIASLVKTAGSSEVVIQHLLKVKQSQSQQNSRLWRLVDKQRAMILGLNKDLEAALKEKEKYRRKLKDVMANSEVATAASGRQGTGYQEPAERGLSLTRIVAIDSQTETASQSPESTSLDSDSQKTSPIDFSMMPSPLTPPADRPHVSQITVGQVLDSMRAMSGPQEHTLNKLAHEADANPAKRSGRGRGEQQSKNATNNVSLPPSRSLPSDPPKMPPPKLPEAPLSPGASEPSSQLDKQLSKVPSVPLRKAPPAPLELKQQVRRQIAVSADEDESDSDYDDILQVDEVIDDIRGRRKTRDNDNKEREVVATRQAQEHQNLRNDAESTTPVVVTPFGGPIGSDDAEEEIRAFVDVSRSSKKSTRQAAAPLFSPGLPETPRPSGNFQHSASAPLSARPSPAAPLSPRPPQQPGVLLPNTPLLSSPGVSASSSAAPLSQVERSGGESSQVAPPERTVVYKGFAMDDDSELLLPPYALSTIMIKVASSRMKPSRASLLSLTQLEEDPVFTLAILSRADNCELWRVEKDITSLGKLDARLRQCTAFTAKTPERSLFSGHAPAKLDLRREVLEQYMEELLETPLDTATGLELCKYLSTHTLPPNADETGSSFRPTPENSDLKIGADGRPLRSGYLTKKGKNFGGWKARFFVLEGPLLKYYEAPGGIHLGTIKLQNAQIVKQSQPQSTDNAMSPSWPGSGEELDNQFRHAFLILEPKKKDSNARIKHVLCAESDQERDLWVDVLLQWIEPRHAEETDSSQGAKTVPGRRAHGQEQPSGSRLKKGSGGSGSSSSKLPLGQGDPDTLIGVRYDSTHAGEAPQRGSAPLSDTARSQSLATEMMNAQATKLISGPKDPQLISDSTAWGNKPSGLMSPTQDEKKQRVRSFFGFGPKTRSSSDGHDSAFAGDASPVNGPTHIQGHQGPVRQVFGAPLAEAVRFSPPMDVDVPLPSVVFRCIQYLDYKNALVEEGIFRLSGSNIVIKQLRERFNVEGDVNLVTDEQTYDIHAVASLLKLYLRELPTTILTRRLHLDFLATTEMQDREEKVSKLSELANQLPQANATLLKYLIAFLIKIINNSGINKMNVRNVGIVFSPTLNIPAQVFAMFLQNYEGIFGVDPEQYEPPAAVKEADPNGASAMAHAGLPKFEPPPRPSTSSGGASPHRQPRMDNMRSHARSTPTPPLIPARRGARDTPTPPLGGHAAHESGYSALANHSGHTFNLPHGQGSTPGHDRSVYQSPTEIHGEQPIKQAESAVHMGGFMDPQYQASKGRLREDALIQ